MRNSLPGITIAIIGALLLSAGCSPAESQLTTEPPATNEPDTSQPTDAPTEAPTEAALPDLSVTGGFVENAVDISTLPEYQFEPMGGDGPLDHAFCPTEIPTKNVLVVGTDDPTVKRLCLYNLPSIEAGQQFTVNLNSPLGESASKTYTLAVINDNLGVSNDAGTYNIGDIMDAEPGSPLTVPLFFAAAYPFGDWQVEATQAGQTFASGVISVAPTEQNFSITLAGEPIDPFNRHEDVTVQAGDRVIFAGRGYQAGDVLTLALYAVDDLNSTETSIHMTPRYAAQAVVSEDGTFWVEFTVGTETPATEYQIAFNPSPEMYSPQRFHSMVVEGE